MARTAFTLGPISASVKGRVSHKQWRSLVHSAHHQGNTIESFLNPSIPRPLKERTPQSLRAQANKTIATSYAPAEKTLSDNETRIKALDDKRKTDLQYYNQWLSDQNAKLDATARAADSQLSSTLASVQGDVHSGAQAIKGQVTSDVQNAAGTVSNNIAGQAKAPQQLDAAEQRASEQIGARQIAGAYGINQAEGDRQLANSANFAQIAALNSKRIADTWTALQDNTDERGKLVLQKAADAAKEVERLMDNEVTKAQNNRDYGLLQDKLGVQQQEFNTTAMLKKLGITTTAATTRRGQDLTNAAALKRINAQISRDANNQAFKDDQFSARYGITRSTWNAFDDKQKQSYLKSAHAQGILTGKGNKSGRTGKAKITQDNYDRAFSNVAGSSFQTAQPVLDAHGKPVLDTATGRPKTKPADHPITPQYAHEHHDKIVAHLIALGYNRRVAEAAVNQFEQAGGSDSGLLHNWLHLDPSTHRQGK